MRPLGVLGFLFVAAFAVWLAIANRTFVIVSLNAFDPGGADSSMAMPLFAVLLIGVLIGLIAGGIYMSAGQRLLRRELVRERERAEKLQAMVADETLANMDRARSAPPARPALVSRLAD